MNNKRLRNYLLNYSNILLNKFKILVSTRPALRIDTILRSSLMK